MVTDSKGKPVDYIFLEVNRAFEEMTGLKREEISGKKVTAVLPGIEKDKFDWIGTYGKVALSGEPVRFENFSEPLGRWNEVCAYSDEQGCFATVFRDISAEKEKASALKRSEKGYKYIANNIPDMIVRFDTKLRHIYLNRVAESFFGLSADFIMGKTFLDFYEISTFEEQLNQLQAMYETLKKCLESGEEQRFSGSFMLPEGEKHLFTRIVPKKEKGGEIVSLLAVTTDITERKKAEEEIRNLNEKLEARVRNRTAQLEAAIRELDAFTHSASHDLRGPLNRMSGFSRALLEDYADRLDAQGKDYLQRINNSCENMGTLIEDLLKLSKVSQHQISREPVELSVLVDIYLKDLQAGEPDRPVETVITPGLVAEGDTALLRIALENLLGNAWKFTTGEEKARIEFGSTVCEGKEAYYLRDNGTGFAMKHAEKIFNAFQRVHDTKTYPGTGIGLSIVSRIINRHGGEIWAEGEPGKGACFYFTLPCYKIQLTQQ